ncbi:hypothetical protein OSTOST_21708 [Ostertagia ostertagi]
MTFVRHLKMLCFQDCDDGPMDLAVYYTVSYSIQNVSANFSPMAVHTYAGCGTAYLFFVETAQNTTYRNSSAKTFIGLLKNCSAPVGG